MHPDMEENKNLTEICGQPSLNKATFITLGNSWGRKEGGIQCCWWTLKRISLCYTYIHLYILFLSVIFRQVSMTYLNVENVS